MANPRRPRPRGISLMLELLLGLTLVSLTIMSLFSLFPVADRSVGLADRTNQATSMARNLIEQKLAEDYDNLLTDPATWEESDVSLVHTKRRGQDLNTVFHYRVEITQPDAGKDVKHIVVIVSWPRGSLMGRAEKVVLETNKGRLW